MSKSIENQRSRAQESTAAIERIYITMRHLLIRGSYKPMGVSGKNLRESLLTLRPEIYGSIAESKVELDGLLYVIERLPLGIEECRFINLTSDEGYTNSHFKVIIPKKRRRNCYRIDNEQINIEITRGRSDIYDILTHLTFLFIESHKIMKNVIVGEDKKLSRDWEKLQNAANNNKLSENEKEVAITHAANILGRTFKEIYAVYDKFSTEKDPNRFLKLIYFLGKLAVDEYVNNDKRVITFSPVLRERLGHHIHGEQWANTIKFTLEKNNLLDRKIHIISANMHSVMNTIYAKNALKQYCKGKTDLEIFEALSKAENIKLRLKVEQYASRHGMIFIDDTSGTNIDVQLFDLSLITKEKEAPVLLVMDYAFGEQAYETIDELLKPHLLKSNDLHYLNVESISVMGKAGILEGGKGDIMIPKAHLFEGTADNYPFDNALTKEEFEGHGLNVFSGSMVTVLGTSLQNRELLKFFHDSTWNVIGLEMEGAHYQKAIQAASKLRGNIKKDITVRYAYYASDNPLESGSTLAQGGLGTTGVKPTYLITEKILEQII